MHVFRLVPPSNGREPREELLKPLNVRGEVEHLELPGLRIRDVVLIVAVGHDGRANADLADMLLQTPHDLLDVALHAVDRVRHGARRIYDKADVDACIGGACGARASHGNRVFGFA